MNPKDCKNPVCGDKMAMFSKAVRVSSSGSKLEECPVDRAECPDQRCRQ